MCSRPASDRVVLPPFIVVLAAARPMLEKPKPLPFDLAGRARANKGRRPRRVPCRLRAVPRAPTPASAPEHEQPHPPLNAWSFKGVFRRYDPGQFPRLQDLSRVCQVCHSLNLVAFRTLVQEGGPDFTEAEVEAIRGPIQDQDGPHDQGEMF